MVCKLVAKYGNVIPITTLYQKCSTALMASSIYDGMLIKSEKDGKDGKDEKNMSDADLDARIHNYYKDNSTWWYREWCRARLSFQPDIVATRLYYETRTAPQCPHCGCRSDAHSTFCE